MDYKKKLSILGAAAAFLAVVYVLSFVFDQQRRNTRKAAYSWLSAKTIADVSAITVRGGSEEGATEIRLDKTDGKWFVNFEDRPFPAKAEWVGELLETLAKSDNYPVRAKTDAAHAKMGVDENAAKRIIVKGKNDALLLDLLIGSTDSTGKRFLRKNGSSEVRAGADNLRAWGTYVTSYYDTRLFPDHDKNKFTVASVQRVLVNPLEGGDAQKAFPAWTLVRSGSGWQVEGKPEVALDTVQTENYVRGLLDASGDDFISALNASDAPSGGLGSIPGRVSIQTGDGVERDITILPEKINDKTPAFAGGSYVYALSDWTLGQIFKNYDSLTAAPAGAPVK